MGDRFADHFTDIIFSFAGRALALINSGQIVVGIFPELQKLFIIAYKTFLRLLFRTMKPAWHCRTQTTIHLDQDPHAFPATEMIKISPPLVT